MDEVIDTVAAVFVVLGALLSLVAGVGVLRFPDALSRLHAGTKPQVLGLVFIVLAVALSARTWTVLLLLIPVVLFQLLTAPVAAHMIGRAGYRTKNLRADLLLVDELADDVERASTPTETAPPAADEEANRPD
ncbi:monovalent cation/H(+) antiporter subunit G [Pseudolysinimonas sp.]|jgi:multicomponent Na+:H+ antiporter subunit G